MGLKFLGTDARVDRKILGFKKASNVGGPLLKMQILIYVRSV